MCEHVQLADGDRVLRALSDQDSCVEFWCSTQFDLVPAREASWVVLIPFCMRQFNYQGVGT